MTLIPRVLTVVLHYGDPDLTARVHEALLPEAAGQEVLVLDNAAPLPYPGALRLPQNVFWGGALEKALALGQERRVDYVWFCNNDIVFLSPPPLIARMAGRVWRLSKVLRHEVGLWAPAVTASPYHPQMLHKSGLQYRLVSCMDGIAPLISLRCVQAIGGLDMGDNARGYGLDLWLSLRAYEAGWPVVVDHQMVVRHRYHTTAATVDGFMDQAARDEDAYMRARLGDNWRQHVREKASRWSDVNEL